MSGLSNHQKDGSDRHSLPQPAHTPQPSYLRKPGGPGLRSQLLRRGALPGKKPGWARRGQGGSLASPGVGTPSAKSQMAGMLLPLQSPTSPPGPAQVCNWGALLGGVATGLRGEVGGGARCGKRGGAERGHPANHHSSCVPFKASRPERWWGRGGSEPANCNASREMEFDARCAELQRAYWGTTSPREQRAGPGPPRPWAGLRPSAPLAKLRWPPAEGRLLSRGRRWVRHGRGRGVQGLPARGHGPIWAPVLP